MASGEKRLIQEDRMEKKKGSKRRQTGATSKDDFELIQSPPSSPRLAPKSSHLTPSLEAPSQLQTPLSSPPTSRAPSPIPPDTPHLVPLPPSRPPSPTIFKNPSTNVVIITVLDQDEAYIDDTVLQDQQHQQNNAAITSRPSIDNVHHRPPCSRCPPELLLHIFEILRAVHQPSLFSCVLVNHEWNAIGTTVLWNTPKFTHMRSLDKFIRTIENIPPNPSTPRQQTLSEMSSTTAPSFLLPPLHPYASYIHNLDFTFLTEHDRNNSALSSHLLRLLPLVHSENLQSLNLSFVKGITNSYLTKLLSPFFTNIRTINLAGGSRSDMCISAVLPHCHNVQHLSLAWNTSLSNVSITKISSLCGGRLRTLDLTNCEKVSDRSMTSIAQHCVKLRELRVSYCRGVSEIGVREVIEACDCLTLLDLVGCLGVSRGFLLKCGEDFGLARRGLRIVWRRDTEGSTWVDTRD